MDLLSDRRQLVAGNGCKCPPRPEMLLHAILKLHEKIQEMPLGVNRERAIAEAEEAAMAVRPTIEMHGLLR